jgi:hypothetical protein
LRLRDDSRFEQRELFGRDEGGVSRRQAILFDHRFERGDQRGGLAVVGQQQAAAGNGGEGDGDLEFGVIIAARALPCVRPGVVEDIFALTVAFYVSGGGSGERAVRAVDEDRRGLPAGAGAGAVRVFEEREERVAEEGVFGSG